MLNWIISRAVALAFTATIIGLGIVWTGYEWWQIAIAYLLVWVVVFDGREIAAAMTRAENK